MGAGDVYGVGTSMPSMDGLTWTVQMSKHCRLHFAVQEQHGT